MSLLFMSCPHCHVENVQFQSIAARHHQELASRWTVFFVCNACRKGIGVTVEQFVSKAPNPHEFHGDLRNIDGLRISEVYPTPVVLAAPQHSPDRVARYYVQALGAAQRQDYDAAGMMCRKALEAATVEIDNELKGNLVAKIDALAAAHKLTPQLREWAHAIRLDGNDAVHGDDFTKEEVEQIVSFTELFLMYVFTLPGMLDERKTKKAQGTGDADARDSDKSVSRAPAPIKPLRT